MEFENYHLTLGILASFLSALNLAYYVYTIFKGKTRPHAYSWLIWTLVSTIAAFGQFQGGGGIGLLATFTSTLSCLTLTILGFYKGEKHITLSDKICLATCLFAIVLWQLAHTPVWSVLIVTCVDAAGFYPTIRKSWNKPYNESAVSFLSYVVIYSLGLLSMEKYNFLTIFYPGTITLCCAALVAFLVIRRYQLRNVSH